MQAAGEVVTSQVDLLWSVALAVLIAKVFLIGRFSEGSPGLTMKRWSWVVLYVGMLSQLFSMLFGYLTYGAIVTMNRCAPVENGTVDSWCQENLVSQSESFSAAELMAFLQFAAFGIGLILFVILYSLEGKKVSRAVKSE